MFKILENEYNVLQAVVDSRKKIYRLVMDKSELDRIDHFIFPRRIIVTFILTYLQSPMIPKKLVNRPKKLQSYYDKLDEFINKQRSLFSLIQD